MSKKIIYPAPERNKPFILEVLFKHFDKSKPGDVLEISSGTGQHVSYFARHFPNLTFQPSEYEEDMFGSILAHKEEIGADNIRDPIKIDVMTDCETWNLYTDRFDYIININLMHISPFECTVGLFKNASRILKPSGLMITYGPYACDGVIEPKSNVDFDKSLRYRNPEWGLRDIRTLEKVGEDYGLKLLEIYDLPSNNKCLVWENVK